MSLRLAAAAAANVAISRKCSYSKGSFGLQIVLLHPRLRNHSISNIRQKVRGYYENIGIS